MGGRNTRFFSPMHRLWPSIFIISQLAGRRRKSRMLYTIEIFACFEAVCTVSIRHLNTYFIVQLTCLECERKRVQIYVIAFVHKTTRHMTMHKVYSICKHRSWAQRTRACGSSESERDWCNHRGRISKRAPHVSYPKSIPTLLKVALSESSIKYTL